MSAETPLERIVRALEAHGCAPDRKGKAKCPAHDDRTASLSVRETKNGGGVALKCFAGCTRDDVLAALGLTWQELYPQKKGGGGNGERPPPGRPDHSWEIRDRQGRLVALHHRRNLAGGKRLWWTTPDGKLGLGGAKASDLPLYGVDRLGEREPGDDAPVTLCEGEPATDALLALGLRAVGTVTGASSVPSVQSLDALRGEHVVLWPDADDAGRAHMATVANLLDGVAASVRLFAPEGLPAGGDAVDWTEARTGRPNVGTELLAEIEERARSAEPERPRFEPLGEEQGYRLVVPALAAMLEVSYLRRERHQLRGEVLARCDLPGASTVDGVLSVAEVNLSSTRSRREHGAHLAEQARTEVEPWIDAVERLAQQTIAAERAGAPACLLHEIPRPSADEALEVDGMPLLARHALILFGDGGTGKSYLALHIAGSLAQRGLRVLYCDWELAGEEHRERLELLFGSEMPVLHYARCARPLFHEAERLRRIVREHRINFVVFDSIAFACDGPPEAAEIAARYFQSLRGLGELGSLHVAHVAKAGDSSDAKPFGSAFWHNGARSTWNVKLAEGIPDDRRISIGCYHRKANLGALRSAIGFELAFDAERTTVRRLALEDAPDLVQGLSIRQRMALTLRRGAMTPESLAQELDAKTETVSRTARRNPRQFLVLDGGRIGLRERSA